MTTVSIYTLAKGSTVDVPAYKFGNSYEVHLYPEDFESLEALKQAVQGVLGSRYLRTQFFRMAFKDEFDRVGFLTTNQKVRGAFKRRGVPPWDMAIVRYTRPQASQLRTRVTQTEAPQLALILGMKRPYSRKDGKSGVRIDVGGRLGPQGAQILALDVPTSRARRVLAGGASDASGGTNTQNGQNGQGRQSAEDGQNAASRPIKSRGTFPDRPREPLVQAMSESSEEESAEPPAGSAPAALPPALRTGVFPDAVGPLFSKDFFLYSDDEDGFSEYAIQDSSLRDSELVISRIRKHCPAASAFSQSALNYWARLIIAKRHRSYSCPPSSFPIPDAFSVAGYRGVSVPSQVHAVCLIYAGYLEERERRSESRGSGR